MLSIEICIEGYKGDDNLFKKVLSVMKHLSDKYHHKLLFYRMKLDLIEAFKNAKEDYMLSAELLLRYESALRLTNIPINVDGLLRQDTSNNTYGITELVLNGDDNLSIIIYLMRYSDSTSDIFNRIKVNYEYKKDDDTRPYARIVYKDYIEFDDKISINNAINIANNFTNHNLIEKLCTLICDSAIDTLKTVELGDKYYEI